MVMEKAMLSNVPASIKNAFSTVSMASLLTVHVYRSFALHNYYSCVIHFFSFAGSGHTYIGLSWMEQIGLEICTLSSFAVVLFCVVDARDSILNFPW